MQNPELTEFLTLSGKLKTFTADCWFNDACISDMDYFIKALSVINGKEVRPEVIGSIITRYASKWLPELAGDEAAERATPSLEDCPESVMASWTKKRFLIETIVGILPPEKDCIPCNFLLRLLRVANVVQVEPACRAELERRISLRLDQASLKEIMIPSFSHTATTLLDVELVIRLLKIFATKEDVSRTGTAVMKVAKLVDSYLAEAAVDSYLKLAEFIELASVLPSHARSTDDGLYRAIDTYLKAHQGLTKQERKTLCNLLDSTKLSQEASLHAAQNDRLPVRTVIQVLLSERTKLNKHMDCSGTLSGARSPAGFGLEAPARCFSKRETSMQQIEIKRLQEDVLRLQSQCMAMEKKIEKLLEKKTGSSYFSWKKFGIPAFKASRIGESAEEESNAAVGLKPPLEMKTRLVRGKTSNRRRSMS